MLNQCHFIGAQASGVVSADRMAYDLDEGILFPAPWAVVGLRGAGCRTARHIANSAIEDAQVIFTTIDSYKSPLDEVERAGSDARGREKYWQIGANGLGCGANMDEAFALAPELRSYARRVLGSIPSVRV